MWYIMRGYHYDVKKASIAELIEEERGNFSIIVCERETSAGKMSPIFLISHGDCMDTKLGSTQYTQDTGNGYKNKGWMMTIQNVIYVNEDGIIANKLNNEGMDGAKRSPWVCK
jgi:hypothetical protein